MKKKKVEIRNAKVSDIAGINNLVMKVYEDEGYKRETIRGQISNFQEGCFVILIN